jgi:hypothetical protein
MLSVSTVRKATYAEVVFKRQFRAFQPAVKVDLGLCPSVKQFAHHNSFALVDSSHQRSCDKRIAIKTTYGHVVDGCSQSNFVVHP